MRGCVNDSGQKLFTPYRIMTECNNDFI